MRFSVYRQAIGFALCGAILWALPSYAAAPSVDDLIKRSDELTLQGKLDEAYAVAQEAVALARKGQDQELIGDALASVCERAVGLLGMDAEKPCTALYDQRVATLGKDHFKTYAAERALANVYLDRDPAKAIALTQDAAVNLERLARTPEEKSQAAAAWSMLALAYKYKGDYMAAIAPYDKALAIMGAPDAEPNIFFASVLTDYADMMITLGDYVKAKSLAEQALVLREKMQDPGHSDIADTLGVLGDALRRMGRYDEAEGYFRRSLRIAEASTPVLAPILARAYQNLGLVYLFTGRLEDAKVLQLKAIDVLKAVGPQGDVLLGGVYNDLANTYHYQGEYRLAFEAIDQALTIVLKNHDRKFDRALSYITLEAQLKYRIEAYGEARTLIDEVLETRLVAAPTSSRTADALSLRAVIRMDTDDLAGARADLEKAHEILKPYSPNSSAAIKVGSLLAQTMLDEDKSEDVDGAYGLAVEAARAQAYVLTQMTRIQGAIGGAQTPADRKKVFDTLLDAAWKADLAGR